MIQNSKGQIFIIKSTSLWFQNGKRKEKLLKEVASDALIPETSA